MRKITLIFVGVVILIFALTNLSNYIRESRQKGSTFFREESSEDLSVILEERKTWLGIYKKVGPEAFWELLKERYVDNYHRHSVAHMYGELLYTQEGPHGISYCDSSFSYGCYHSFFGLALASEGVAIVGKLDDACVERYGETDSGCQHGIGHGLLQFLGYGQLNEALDLCDSLPKRGTSCFEGVFMEFNFPTDIVGVSANEMVREFDNKSPYKPCYSMAPDYKNSCFYELPRWWERATESDFARMGILCNGITDNQFREHCYRGIGAVSVIATAHDLKKTFGNCNLMVDTFGKNNCLIEASWAFYSISEYRDLASEVCKDLSDETKKKCKN